MIIFGIMVTIAIQLFIDLVCWLIFYAIPLFFLPEIFFFLDFLKNLLKCHTNNKIRLVKGCHSIRENWEFLNEKGAILKKVSQM
jgi:hypothetical protein